MESKTVKPYNLELDYSCNGVDISKGKNTILTQQIMLDKDFGWYEEKIDEFLTFHTFENVNDVTGYVDSSYSEADAAIADWLTYKWEDNPQHIRLDCQANTVWFMPREPWEYEEAEKQLDEASVINLLEKVGKLFQVE